MARKIVVCATGLLVALWTLVPAPAGAQTGNSAIAGAVKDATGAVLPGVTVEAASPELIEKVRTATTDGEGLYKITDLRPGTYVVTFTLPGFSIVKREGLDLTSNFTATVNAELKVGSVEETITVSGEVPVVDTQSVLQQQVFTRTMMDNLPASRNYSRVLGAHPAARGVNDVGGTSGEYLTPGNVHGSRISDTSYELDGMLITGGYHVGGANNMFYLNNGSIQEMTTEVSGMSAESMLGGMRFNAIPKEGGNTLQGQFFANFANNSMQGSNVDQELITRGTRDPNSLDKVWDINPSLGGPILKDKLWFFWGARYWGTYSAVAGNYYNQTPNSNKYAPDLNRQAQWRQHLATSDLRLTWQLGRNKFNVFYGYEYSNFIDGLTVGGSTNAAPEAIPSILFQPNYIGQATWSLPLTNRLLLQAGGTVAVSRYYAVPQPESLNVYTLQEQSTVYFIQGTSSQSDRRSNNYNYRASASYVTGSHAIKAGMALQQGWTQDNTAFNPFYQSLQLFMLNGTPRSVTQFADPRTLNERLKANLGLYAQDQYRFKRLTFNGGLRFDYLNAYIPEQDLPAGLYVPARHFNAIYDEPSWKDLSPRVGVAYDLFGNGKTALKGSLGRYPIGDGTSIFTRLVNPVQATVNSASRAWTDDGRNGGIAGDFVPQCNFTVLTLNGECAQVNNLGFGGVQQLTNYSEAVRQGFNVRQKNWEGSVGVQHEVIQGLGVGAAYFHRGFGNQQITRNLLTKPSDFDSFCVTAPVDSRLGPVSGTQVCGFKNITPTLFGQVNNLIEPVSNYGNIDESFNGVDLTINARFPNGATITGGMATGKSLFDSCEVLAKNGDVSTLGSIDLVGSAPPPNFTGGVTLAPSTVFCHQETPWLNQLKIFAVYPLPWAFQASVNISSIPGPVITATYPATNQEVQPTLGRPLAGNQQTVTVNLINPGSQYDRRINQTDFRLTRNFAIGGNRRVIAMMDIYNLFNGNADTTLRNAYGPLYLQPTRIVTARMLKLGVQVNF